MIEADDGDVLFAGSLDYEGEFKPVKHGAKPKPVNNVFGLHLAAAVQNKSNFMKLKDAEENDTIDASAFSVAVSGKCSHSPVFNTYSHSFVHNNLHNHSFVHNNSIELSTETSRRVPSTLTNTKRTKPQRATTPTPVNNSGNNNKLRERQMCHCTECGIYWNYQPEIGSQCIECGKTINISEHTVDTCTTTLEIIENFKNGQAYEPQSQEGEHDNFFENCQVCEPQSQGEHDTTTTTCPNGQPTTTTCPNGQTQPKWKHRCHLCERQWTSDATDNRCRKCQRCDAVSSQPMVERHRSPGPGDR